MTWERIVVPFTTEISPDMVEIGRRGLECFVKDERPEGWAMFHATEGPGRGDEQDHFIVYFSPVAAASCREAVSGDYTLEPCEVPHHNEPNVSFVFGDPKVMAVLRTD